MSNIEGTYEGAALGSEALDPRTPTYEVIHKIAAECLIGTGLALNESIVVDHVRDALFLHFHTTGRHLSLPVVSGHVNQGIPKSALVAGGEVLHREVVAACNRARTSISAALRATAAKLEPR